MNTYKSLAVHTGIIDAMVDSKLDPKEFFEFVGKYGEFIEFGMAAKKMDVIASDSLHEINIARALDLGCATFSSFMRDFETEYKQKALER